MAADPQMPRPVFTELRTEPTDAAMPIDAPVTDADTTRSKENIAQWKTYLPEDCAKTMIEMGWDVTT